LQKYNAPPSQLFSAEDILLKKNQVTRKSYADSFIYHPTGVIVEFPEAAAVLKGSVAHFFPVNSENYIDPKENIQYSLGGQHGG
ncbi:hypothetical protein BU17DRAFT_19401, partial [Hysterangium stoloniferum]